MRRVLEEVYADPDFARAEPGLLQRAFDRVMEAIAQAFDAAAGTGMGRVVGIVLLLALAAVCAWLLARALSRVRRDRPAGIEVEGPVGRSAADWAADAEAHERRGEHLLALRCHYRATVAWLAARGLVDEVPGTTTGEYRAAVGDAAPDAAGPFGELTDAFERAWYGRRAVTADEVRAAVDAAEATKRAARRPAGSAAS